MEIFKSIKNYPEGRVKHRNIILTPVNHNNGYLIVKLYKNGKYKWFLIHRLVAEAFLPKNEGEM
jgi:hypothetical protein